MRNKTMPGKYTVGCWQELEAQKANDDLAKQVISTKHLTVVRCDYKPGSVFEAHIHDTEQITIIEEGKLIFIVDEEELDVEAGQMISVMPGVSHASSVDGEQPAKALNIFYNPNNGEPESA